MSDISELRGEIRSLRTELHDAHATTRRELREDLSRIEVGFRGWQEKQDDTLKEHDKLHGTHHVTLAEIKTRVFIYAATISTLCGIIGSGLVAFLVKRYA